MNFRFIQRMSAANCLIQLCNIDLCPCFDVSQSLPNAQVKYIVFTMPLAIVEQGNFRIMNIAFIYLGLKFKYCNS
jgi:hypothetical protein